MKQLNVCNWKPFNITDIFIVKNTHSILSTEIETDNGIYPYVTASKVNNGVETYANIEKDKVEKGKCILIGGKTMSITFQSQNFISNDSHNLALYIKGDMEISENIWFFLKTAVEASISHLYSWGSSISKTSIQKDVIYLPVDKNNEPDWGYMDKYIGELRPKVLKRVDYLIESSRYKPLKLDIGEWKSFHLYDIFHIDQGTKLDRVNMDTSVEEINFVGRSNVNNGITAKCKRIEGLEPYSKGYLTLALGGAYLGSCFVQDAPFYTSQNVNVLIPIEDISYLAKQFIATTIFIESQNNYQAFIKELNSHIRTDFTIKLPSTDNKKPDYRAMENYMEGILNITNRSIKSIINIR